MFHTVMGSPVGPLTLVGTGGALTGLYMDRQRYRPEEATFGDRDDAPFAAAVAQLEEYFAGRLTEFDLPLNLIGTPFQRQVWETLLTVPYGRTVSYAELADRLGRPRGAARAVGLANGHNPISIIVPCHRVVGADGGLTGYGGGLDRKRHLLDFEHRVSTRG